MAFEVDDQRPALSPSARESLVRAVVAAPPAESETDWIEWKGRVDSLQKWAPRIAFYVIGFANRPVARAARHAAGWGYLLLGAEPQAVHGLQRVDTADLIKWLARYLGDRGPQWDPHFIDLDGKTVLLIAVEPPRTGDPMHAVRRSFQGEIAGKEVDMTDGDVVIRTGSETRRARSAELDLLQTRAAGSGPRLAVSILNRSEELTAVDTRDEQRSRWLATERRRLLGSMDPPRSPLGNQMIELSRGFAAGQESRSPDDYRREVETYLNDAATAWGRRLEWIAARNRLAELRLEVRNDTESNFRAVELIVSIPGRVTAAWEGEWDDPDLPKSPRPWASGTSFLSGLALSAPTFLDTGFGHLPSPGTGYIDNSGPARIAFDEFDLRPDETFSMESVVLLISELHAGRAIEATYTLTAKSVDGSVQGALSLPVSRMVVPPAGVGEREG